MRMGHKLMMAAVLTGVVSGGLVGGLDGAHAALVTQLDFTGGAANWNSKQEQAVDQAFARGGSITLGSYQSWGEISSGGKQYSLLTSNVLGAAAPTATINGMSISVDLSSLFLAQKQGGELRLWNIGGQATGLYNPQTSEFSISWKHLSDSLHSNRGGDTHREGHKSSWEKGGWGEKGSWGGSTNAGTFFLQGTAIDTAPVALPAAVYLYSTGLLGVGYAWMKKRRATSTVTAAVPAA